MIFPKNNLLRDIVRTCFSRPCARSAILKTLCYADIFDYPLTKKELFRFLITKEKISEKDFFRILDMHIPGVGRLGPYYFLNGKKNLKKWIEEIGFTNPYKLNRALNYLEN